mgnify:FL=1
MFLVCIISFTLKNIYKTLFFKKIEMNFESMIEKIRSFKIQNSFLETSTGFHFAQH